MNQPSLRKVFSDPVYLLAFGFGSGLAKKAPGTFGSLAAVLPFLLLMRLPPWAYMICVVVAFCLGVLICGKAAKRLNVEDPAGIVWDEFVGLWIALFLIPEGWGFLLAGFLLFRVFDIVKPWPVNYFDTNFHGGLGIMLDDVVAGVYAFIVLQMTALILGIPYP